MKILAHTSFIGTTGYANHARSFFCALNKLHTVKVRNYTVGSGWKEMSNTPHDDESYITPEMKDMLILQTLWNDDKSRSDYPMYDYKGDFEPDVNIILEENNHHYYYEDYVGYKIGYCVYESTRFPDHFFARLHYYDEMWVPTQWQADSLAEQGYPKEKITVIPEGVDIDTFKPLDKLPKKDKFRFLHFGRWDYRKSTAEVLKAFGEAFGNNPNVELIASVENPYPYDETRSTEERMDKFDIHYGNIKYVKFVPREEYVKYLQEGDVFISCARSEGWNLPLIEAMSCGIPALYSDWGGQLQFAKGKGVPVKISHLRPANIGNSDVGGEYCEPNFMDLRSKIADVHCNYDEFRNNALLDSAMIHEEFNWENVAKIASDVLEKNVPLLPRTDVLSHNSDFYRSNWFYTDVHKIEDFTPIVGIKAPTMSVAEKFSWQHAVYHEIYNLQDYYKHREKKIKKGDIVVDVGANMGVFTRWAYKEGASKVFSFEPDRRYFKLLQLNSGPRTTLFNAAISDTMEPVVLHESSHFGGSNVFHVPDSTVEYETKAYTLDYLFESGTLDKIDFLKIDIEGGEINAFKGISDENLKKVGAIGMEYHHSHLGYDEELRTNLIHRLNELGFASYLSFLGTNGALQMLYFTNESWREKRETDNQRSINLNFIDGPFVEIKEDVEHLYHVQFIDLLNDKVDFELDLKSNHWCRASKKYHVDWMIKINGIDNDHEFEHIFNPQNKRVLISIDSKAIGDTLGWFPTIEKFRIEKDCHVICSTFHNNLFKSEYPDIEFVEPGDVVHDIYASYKVGVFLKDGEVDFERHKTDPKMDPLISISSNILGLGFTEEKPRLPLPSPVVKQKVVSIAIHGTAQCKYWNNPRGWQEVVNYLVSKGYEVKLLSREHDGYMGNKNPKNVTQVKPGSLENVIEVIRESELFIGISSGLSWVSWATGTETILISGFTDAYTEPQIGVRRVINEDVCYGCWNKHVFDPGDWQWCPVHKGTDRQFECSKSITAETVIDQINLALGL